MSSAERTASDEGAAEPAEEPAGGGPRITGVRRAVVGAAAVLVSCAVLLHMTTTFFHVAPGNVIRDEYHTAIRGYLYPEFRQAWNLFAPELPANDTRVHARALVRLDDGTTATTEWADLTAPDIGELRSGLLPTRARHQLRKSWSDVRRYQDAQGAPAGYRGADARAMATRIALRRLPLPDGATVEQLQFRTVTTPIDAPPWQEQPEAPPTHQETAWWPVAEVLPEAAPGGDR